MNKYFIQLFREESTVILPGFGALTMTSERTGEIMFMPYLKFDDGKLAAYIAQTDGIEEQAAKNMIAKFIREIQTELDKGESFDIFEFGKFFKNAEGEVEFETDPAARRDNFGEGETEAETEAESEAEAEREEAVDVDSGGDADADIEREGETERSEDADADIDSGGDADSDSDSGVDLKKKDKKKKKKKKKKDEDSQSEEQSEKEKEKESESESEVAGLDEAGDSMDLINALLNSDEEFEVEKETSEFVQVFDVDADADLERETETERSEDSDSDVEMKEEEEETPVVRKKEVKAEAKKEKAKKKAEAKEKKSKDKAEKKEADVMKEVSVPGKKKKKRGLGFWLLIVFLLAFAGGAVYAWLNFEAIKPHLPFLHEEEDKYKSPVDTNAMHIQVMKELSKTPEEISDSIAEANEADSTDQTSTENEGEMSQSTATEEPAPEPKAPVQAAKTGGFHIIVGAFSTMDNAQALFNELKSKGFTPAMAGKSNGMNLVSAGLAPTRAEALEILAKAKAEYSGAWLKKN